MLRLRSGVFRAACAGRSLREMACKVFLSFFAFCPLHGCNTQVPEVFRLPHFSGLCWINAPGGAVLALCVSCHNMPTIECHPSAVVLSSKTVQLILFQCTAERLLLACCPVAPKSLLNPARTRVVKNGVGLYLWRVFIWESLVSL